MAPTRRMAVLLAGLALTALVLPAGLVALAIVALLAAAAADAYAVRTPPEISRSVPHLLARGVGARLSVEARGGRARRVRIRQPVPPDLVCDPGERDERFESTLTARRRGRHLLPPVAVRAEGPLGLGAWYHQAVGAEAEVLVYPDLPGGRRLATAVRRGRFREAGQLAGGPLGLGTEFESIRDYLPDDDVRQVNWRATARLGRPMSNQFRVEQDRDVIVVVDCGRLMGAPLGDATRLDAALDAAVAVAYVADVVGDRCGTLAFDARVLRRVRPRRAGADPVVHSLFDLEPSAEDSDYELAFRTVGEAKRAFVLVLTDLIDERAARPLIDAVPILARHHTVAVASTTDPDLGSIVGTSPARPSDVYAAAVALEVLAERERAIERLRHAGAQIVEAPPATLPQACVVTYLRAKVRARV